MKAVSEAWRGDGTRLQAVLDVAPAIVYVLDLQDRYLFVNLAWQRTFGMEQGQVVGRSIHEVFPAATAQAMAQQNRCVRETRAALESESVVDVGGGELILANTKVPLFSGGELVAVCGLSVDITERKRSEGRLRLVSELATALVMHADDVDSFLEEMCRKLAAELGGDIYFHYRVDIPARSLRLASCGGVGSDVVADLAQLDFGVAVCGTVAATRHAWLIGDVQACGDDRARLIRDLGIASYACCPLLSGGKLFGTLSLGRSRAGRFTEQDCQLMQTVCDLASAALDRAARVRDLTEVDRRRKEFLAVLAHELRGPLAPIKAATAMLRLGGNDAGVSKQAREVIERQVTNLSCLVDELLDSARVSHGKITLESNVSALDLVIGQAEEMSRPLIVARGHVYSVSLPSAPVYVRGDHRRLAQIVANLLANAAKYTPRGGRISLDVTADAALVTLRVRDNGVGIPAEVLPRIFNVFEQAGIPASAGTEGGGLGIGLSLVKAITELHGGSIEARSEGVGKGSEFILRLPRSEPAEGVGEKLH